MSDWLTVHIGDNRVVLDTLPEQSIHCVVTSPPYWGLRDYGVTDQLGLEATPEEYVANMVDVFRKVRRVLRDDGTLWLNLGDSYVGGPAGNTDATFSAKQASNRGNGLRRSRAIAAPSLKPKDLVGIPWRVAFALQADGWYLRSDIIWAKPNPMPESVTDRPTKSHEYLFLLTKSPRYYFDQEAVREAHRVELHVPTWDERRAAGAGSGSIVNGHNASHGKGLSHDLGNPSGRNIRTVWTIPTQPYPGAHFAVFPPALVEPCVKAGTSERGVCGECGAPWERVVERTPMAIPERQQAGRVGVEATPHVNDGARRRAMNGQEWAKSASVATTGWRPTCDHAGEPVPATVLDPFAGSGTVGVVANKLSRRAVLIDLNPDYLDQIEKRNAQSPLGLTS